MNEMKQAGPAALAWLGDAVYEIEVRLACADYDAVHTDALHKSAVPFVCAKGQSIAIRALFDTLREDEKAVVLHARNKKPSSLPRHADPVDYRWATGFEALFGYWKLNGEEDRIRGFAAEAMRVIRERMDEVRPKRVKTDHTLVSK
ncbi:MAG: ribonuclease III [Firmicutes bacterium]|nr:ribonuclease III [Bacillota bacterium]